MEFIADILLRIAQRLAQEQKADLDWPIERFREAVSAQFMDELLARAKAASRLPAKCAGSVARVLYQCFMVADRLHHMRGVPDAWSATADQIQKQEQLARIEVGKLKDAHELLLAYVNGSNQGVA